MVLIVVVVVVVVVVAVVVVVVVQSVVVHLDSCRNKATCTYLGPLLDRCQSSFLHFLSRKRLILPS